VQPPLRAAGGQPVQPPLLYVILTWLYSRKYGTVCYHPASSKVWNLTTLSFVNFQGKLIGTSWNLFACEASLFGLLCA
jgi:hypothetical protein